MKKFGENRPWAYPGTALIFWVPPIISGTGKATNLFHRVHANKSPLKIWQKRERGCIQGLPKFFEYPMHIISWTGKATNFKFCTGILSIYRNNSPLQMSGKVAGCVVRTLETFQGTHILGASRGCLCDSSAFLLQWRSFVVFCLELRAVANLQRFLAFIFISLKKQQFKILKKIFLCFWCHHVTSVKRDLYWCSIGAANLGYYSHLCKKRTVFSTIVTMTMTSDVQNSKLQLRITD